MADVGVTYQSNGNPYTAAPAGPAAPGAVVQGAGVTPPPATTPPPTTTEKPNPYTVPAARKWTVDQAWKGIQGLNDWQRKAVMDQIFYAMQGDGNDKELAKELYSRMYKQITGSDWGTYGRDANGNSLDPNYGKWSSWMLNNSEQSNEGQNSYVYDPSTGYMSNNGGPRDPNDPNYRGFFIDPSMLGYGQQNSMDMINKYYGGVESFQNTWDKYIPEWQRKEGNSAYLPWWYKGTRSDPGMANDSPAQPWNAYQQQPGYTPGPSLANAFTSYVPPAGSAAARTADRATGAASNTAYGRPGQTTANAGTPAAGANDQSTAPSPPPSAPAPTSIQNQTRPTSQVDDPYNNPYGQPVTTTPYTNTRKGFGFGKTAEGWNI